MSALARKHVRPLRMTPVEREAQRLRAQQAIDLIRFPDLHQVAPLNFAQRESLLAAVVWPSEQLLEWSIKKAQAKIARALDH